MVQGIEYDSLSILRIDDKYNPVAHDSPATQLKQYWYANGEKHEKSQLKHSKYHFNLPELVRGKDTPIALVFFMASKMYCPFLNTTASVKFH